MLQFFPFVDRFDLRMGTAMLQPHDVFLDVDHHYREELELKKRLLTEDPGYYCQASEDSGLAQWETVELILNWLAAHQPQYFALQKDNNQWIWKNKVLQQQTTFTPGDAAIEGLVPIDWVGRQVQEDLLLLDANGILRGGQLCFPSGWDLPEKINQHFLKIHGPLPGMMDPMMAAANKLMERLAHGRPMVRLNWGFRVNEQLDLSSRHSAAYRIELAKVVSGMTPDNAGDLVFVRTERQTLHRLPCGWILFTIHTYNSKVSEEARITERARAMHSFLASVPLPLQQYKLIDTFSGPLHTWLGSQLTSAG